MTVETLEFTLDTARKIAGVLAQADGQCVCCAESLADDAAKVWPEYPWHELVAKAGGWGSFDDPVLG